MIKNSILSFLLFISFSTLCVADKKADILFEDFYIVLPPPVASGTAAYGTISNHGKQADTLLDIQSELSGMVMLHKTEIESGMAEMIHIETFELKPNENLILKPMSYHLMFTGIKKGELKDGEKVSLSFIFKNAGVIKLEIPVRKPE